MTPITEKCEHTNTHTVRTGDSEWILDCDDCGYKLAKIVGSRSPVVTGKTSKKKL